MKQCEFGTHGGDLRGSKPGYAEIGDLGALDAMGGGVGEQDVGGLDVAMDDTVFVSGVEGIGNLFAEVVDAPDREALAGIEQGGQGAAGDVLHDQERSAVVLAHVIDGDNSGQKRGRPASTGNRQMEVLQIATEAPSC